MPTIVHLELHDQTGKPVPVDLDRLTPRARALAEIIASTPLRTRSHVVLESVRTLREMGANADDEALYGAAAMDRPHRTYWEHWARYPSDSLMDPHDYLEGEARKLPVGYYPAGRGCAHRVPSADIAAADTDLITSDQVMTVLREHGRPITAATLSNYRSRPPAGWPQPVEYVGRTPRWSHRDILAYAQAGRLNEASR